MGWTHRIARLFRHRVRDERDTRRAIPPAMVDRLTRSVAESEKHHTGEIRVCVEASLPSSYVWRDAAPRERALAMFGKLRVWDTEHNNGVLIYLLLVEHAIEIVADRGVTSRVSQAEWERVVDAMRSSFRGQRYEEGLQQAIDAVTAILVRHFPARAGQRHPNELPDEPLLG